MQKSKPHSLSKQRPFSKVHRIYLLSMLLNGPLFALYGIMSFILFKDIGASPLQLAALVSIKPVVALLSAYWMPLLSGRIKAAIMWASVIGVFPVFFFPWINQTSLFIAAFGAYFLCERAVIPGWMEYLRRHEPESSRSRLVSRGSLINFTLTAFTPFLFGPLLDTWPSSWRLLFPILGVLSLSRLVLQLLLPESPGDKKAGNHSISIWVKRPWVDAFCLLKQRPDFYYYQWVFIFGGLGLMLMQPALPSLIQEELKLSYTELGLAFALCKGLGFMMTNSIWSSKLSSKSIFMFCSFVTLVAALSIGSIYLSMWRVELLYFGFILYGAMQAGSQLCWQLGGALFSREASSVPFTSVNILFVGIRGLIGPLLGGLLLQNYGFQAPFLMGLTSCFIGTGIGLFGQAYFKDQVCRP